MVKKKKMSQHCCVEETLLGGLFFNENIKTTMVGWVKEAYLLSVKGSWDSYLKD